MRGSNGSNGSKDYDLMPLLSCIWFLMIWELIELMMFLVSTKILNPTNSAAECAIDIKIGIERIRKLMRMMRTNLSRGMRRPEQSKVFCFWRIFKVFRSLAALSFGE